MFVSFAPSATRRAGEMHPVVREPENFKQTIFSDPVEDEVARSADPVLRLQRSVCMPEMKRADARLLRNRLRVRRSRDGLEHTDGC